MIPEVVEETLWTERAKVTFNKIIEWLRQEWTEREVDKLISRTEETLVKLKRYPEMCRPSTKRRNVRICILDKHTQLIYHYKPRKKQIVVLLFWGMKQDKTNFKF
jgi:plasmid stabilization system protein ParE